MSPMNTRRSFLMLALVPVVALSACADNRSADQRELDALLKEKKQLDADIAGEQRMAGQTQDGSNSGELDRMKEKQSELDRKIMLVKERMQEGGAGS